MNISIVGASGRLGRSLTASLLRKGSLGEKPIEHLTLYDLVPPRIPDDVPFPVTALAGDFSAFGEAERLLAPCPDVIFQLAAALPAQAQEDFEAGYRINLDGNRRLLDAIRATAHCPRLVFASSYLIAPRRGAPPTAPTSSYAVQKAIVELLIEDYSQHGFVDGIAPRLAMILGEDGRRTGAMTAYLSDVIRAPFAAETAQVCVPADLPHWVTSANTAIAQLLHAATIDTTGLAGNRAINMPGLTVTVGGITAGLSRITECDMTEFVTYLPDEATTATVSGWPDAVDTDMAERLGFPADPGLDDILKTYLDRQVTA